MSLFVDTESTFSFPTHTEVVQMSPSPPGPEIDTIVALTIFVK